MFQQSMMQRSQLLQAELFKCLFAKTAADQDNIGLSCLFTSNDTYVYLHNHTQTSGPINNLLHFAQDNNNQICTLSHETQCSN